jgi:hypothetical protein
MIERVRRLSIAELAVRECSRANGTGRHPRTLESVEVRIDGVRYMVDVCADCGAKVRPVRID